MNTRSKCCIIGIPDHQAVIHVGGRIGAAKGPAAFRRLFYRLQGKDMIPQKWVEDYGDVPGLVQEVAVNHRQAADLIKRGHSESGFSIVVGGGHDHGFSHLLGISECLTPTKKLGCLNIDAHLDVRKPNPLISSGSPFYLAIESGILIPERFVEFGIQSHCNSQELWDYVETRQINVVPFSQLRRGNAVDAFRASLEQLALVCDQVVISLDLDSVASAFSPGVSAPQAEGLTPMELIEMIEISGKSKKVVSLGIFELNPEHDLGEQSARLAATAAFHFIEAKLALT
jgi:formimidoylglutamase